MPGRRYRRVRGKERRAAKRKFKGKCKRLDATKNEWRCRRRSPRDVKSKTYKRINPCKKRRKKCKRGIIRAKSKRTGKYVTQSETYKIPDRFK